MACFIRRTAIGLAAIFAVANAGGVPSGLQTVAGWLTPLNSSLGRWLTLGACVVIIVGLNLSRTKLIELRVALGLGDVDELVDEQIRLGQEVRDRLRFGRVDEAAGRVEYMAWFFRASKLLADRKPAAWDDFVSTEFEFDGPRVGPDYLAALTDSKLDVLKIIRGHAARSGPSSSASTVTQVNTLSDVSTSGGDVSFRPSQRVDRG